MTSPAQLITDLKKEKQGFRLAYFAPILLPVSLLPKPGFSNHEKTVINFVRIVD